MSTCCYYQAVVVVVAFDISLDLTKSETIVKSLYSKVSDNSENFVDILVESLKCKGAFLSTIQQIKRRPPTVSGNNGVARFSATLNRGIRKLSLGLLYVGNEIL